MNRRAISCGKCSQRLPDDAIGKGRRDCPLCSTTNETIVFPALFRQAEAVRPDQLAIDDEEAACFYHADKKASIYCDVCGRFLCELCRVDLGNQCVCPSCIHGNSKNQRIDKLGNRRPLRHRMALLSTLIGFPLFMLLIPAIAAIVLGIMAWRSAPPVYEQSNTRERLWATMAIAIGSIELLCGAYFLMRIYYGG
jgi:hypothetical protein